MLDRIRRQRGAVRGLHPMRIALLQAGQRPQGCFAGFAVHLRHGHERRQTCRRSLGVQHGLGIHLARCSHQPGRQAQPACHGLFQHPLQRLIGQPRGRRDIAAAHIAVRPRKPQLPYALPLRRIVEGRVDVIGTRLEGAPVLVQRQRLAHVMEALAHDGGGRGDGPAEKRRTDGCHGVPHADKPDRGKPAVTGAKQLVDLVPDALVLTFAFFAVGKIDMKKRRHQAVHFGPQQAELRDQAANAACGESTP